jgi:DNA-binding GntR family transcriptional regulator
MDLLSDSLKTRVYEWLRDQVLAGHLPPGMPVSCVDIAKHLHVSRFPVADVLRYFERAGLFESRSRAGTRVRVPSASEVADRYIIREALDCQAARYFALRSSAEQRAELLKHAKHLDSLFTGLAGASREILVLTQRFHFDFHVRIAAVSGSKLLRELVEQEHLTLTCWLLYAYDSTRAAQLHFMGVPPDWHMKLATSLVSGSVSRAVIAARIHVEYGQEDMLRALAHSNPKNWRHPGAVGN